ncbi:hypothetical protein AH4AK4_1948 [Aeromonas hydrophila 4AK4]|nr:hypothetical protein AH4AK4_1948 [Aeromonas hydrophila 4AK4]
MVHLWVPHGIAHGKAAALGHPARQARRGSGCRPPCIRGRKRAAA